MAEILYRKDKLQEKLLDLTRHLRAEVERIPEYLRESDSTVVKEIISRVKTLGYQMELIRYEKYSEEQKERFSKYFYISESMSVSNRNNLVEDLETCERLLKRLELLEGDTFPEKSLSGRVAKMLLQEQTSWPVFSYSLNLDEIAKKVVETGGMTYSGRSMWVDLNYKVVKKDGEEDTPDKVLETLVEEFEEKVGREVSNMEAMAFVVSIVFIVFGIVLFLG